jgi:hypothetical protein
VCHKPSGFSLQWLASATSGLPFVLLFSILIVMMKTLLILFITAASPALGDTLLKGAVYFDSRETLDQIVTLAGAEDNAAIDRLINQGRISLPTETEQEVVVALAGNTPESPVQFHFLNSPTPYWTLNRFLVSRPLISATPIPLPTPASTSAQEARPVGSPSPLPLRTPPPSEEGETPPATMHKKHRHAAEGQDKVAPFHTDGGRRIWHKNAAGEWKYYLKDYPPKKPPRAMPVASPPKPSHAISPASDAAYREYINKINQEQGLNL